MLGVYLVKMGSVVLTLEQATVIQTDRRSLKTTFLSSGDPQMDIVKLLLFLFKSNSSQEIALTFSVTLEKPYSLYFYTHYTSTIIQSTLLIQNTVWSFEPDFNGNCFFISYQIFRALIKYFNQNSNLLFVRSLTILFPVL